jgi:hypothetical protein
MRRVVNENNPMSSPETLKSYLNTIWILDIVLRDITF